MHDQQVRKGRINACGNKIYFPEWPSRSCPQLHHHPVGWPELEPERFWIRYRLQARCGMVCGLLPLARRGSGIVIFRPCDGYERRYLIVAFTVITDVPDVAGP